MFGIYSQDESFALVVGSLLTLIFWGIWFFQLAATARKIRPRGQRWPLALAPVACAAVLFIVLKHWSAEDVQSDPAYILFYMIIGGAWVGLFRTQLPYFGLSARDDALERGNNAAGWAIVGALLGGSCCFAGGNVGNGPGWWVVLYSAWLSTTSLVVLWWIIHVCTDMTDKLTIERDLGAGLRAAGFFVGAGLILGRAVAGDWVSTAATTLDFARMAWPAPCLAVAAIALERCCPPAVAPNAWATFVAGWIPAAAYVGAGALVMLAW